MKILRRNLIKNMPLTMLLVFSISSLASADVPSDAKNALRAQGAVVIDGAFLDLTVPLPPPLPPISSFMFQSVDCLGSTQALCANFANSAVTYGGFLVPCRFGQCTAATPSPVPIPGFPLGGGFQLAPDEAVVLYGKLPPEGSYVGFETSFHERHIDNFPNFDPDPLRPGENPPLPAAPDRIVVSSDIGDTENTLALPSAPDPDGNPAGYAVFVKIITGNDQVANMISASLIGAGFPASAITVKKLPSTYVLSADAGADTYREILRIARPFDQAEIDAYVASSPFDPWRVTVPGIGFTGYPEVTHTPRDLGIDEDSQSCGITTKFAKFVKTKFGKHPDLDVTMVPREYDDEKCIDDGTYCWGNNNDALYLDARHPDDSLVTFDLSDNESRLVITGLDHVGLGHSEVWNWDIYDPADGLAQETYLFSDAQADDFSADVDEFCGQNPKNCSCGGGDACNGWSDKQCAKNPVECAAAVQSCRANFPNRLTDELYFVQLRQTCEAGDDHCIELIPTKTILTGPPQNPTPVVINVPPTRQLMHRVYLNPETRTGPSLTETRAPRLLSYE